MEKKDGEEYNARSMLDIAVGLRTILSPIPHAMIPDSSQASQDGIDLPFRSIRPVRL